MRPHPQALRALKRQLLKKGGQDGETGDLILAWLGHDVAVWRGQVLSPLYRGSEKRRLESHLREQTLEPRGQTQRV